CNSLSLVSYDRLPTYNFLPTSGLLRIEHATHAWPTAGKCCRMKWLQTVADPTPAAASLTRRIDLLRVPACSVFADIEDYIARRQRANLRNEILGMMRTTLVRAGNEAVFSRIGRLPQ